MIFVLIDVFVSNITYRLMSLLKEYKEKFIVGTPEISADLKQ